MRRQRRRSCTPGSTGAGPGFENLPGYLYRVGQSRTRWRKPPVTFAPVVDYDDPMVLEPGLGEALATLSVRQRTAVVLVHGFGWTLREVADHTGTRVTTVQNHLERGLTKLRRQIGGTSS